MEKDAESLGTPEMYACNGSRTGKTCKHQSKRDRLVKERELLRQQEESPHLEECQDLGKEGKKKKILKRIRWRKAEYKRD